MSIICGNCGRDIDAIGQDNMSYGDSPVCESCDEKEDIRFAERAERDAEEEKRN